MKLFSIVCSLFFVSLSQAQTAPSSAPAGFMHLFYFDASGSMRNRVGIPESGERERLQESLFHSDWLFHAGQQSRCYQFTVQVEPVNGMASTLNIAQLGEFVEKRWTIGSGNTDLVGVLDSAQQVAAGNPKGATTLAWILTDNVNDPNGAGGDVENTRAFYQRMFQNDTNVQRLYFFPMTDFKLVLYLLVFSSDPALGGLDLDHFEKELGTYAKTIRAPRIRAKPVGGERPLEIDPRIQFEGVSQDVSAEMIGIGRRGALVVHGMKEHEPLSGIFKLRLKSRFEEWRIEKATIERTSLDGIESTDFPNILDRLSARLTPNGITVDPQSTSSIAYSMELGSQDAPLTPEAPFFSLAAMSPDATGIIRGRLSLKIGNPKLQLKLISDPKLTKAVRQIFQLEDIEYFVPKNLASEQIRLDFAIPVDFEVSYRWGIRWLFWAAVLLLPVLMIFLFFSRSSHALNIRVEGYSDATITLSGKVAYPISPAGKALAQLTSSFGGVLCRPLEGALVNGSRKAVALKSGSHFEIQREDASYRYRLEILKDTKAPPSSQSSSPGGFY
jgi:hypothetical protein